MSMDLLDGMKTFAAVVEAGSFTVAGERLGISKKLASKYVGELEDRLGVRLLHRTTRTLSLTGAGQRYHLRCVALIEDLEELETSLREAESGLAGTLRVAAPVSFGELYVWPLLRRFRRDHPDLTIDLRLNDRYVDLAEGGFDLAIRIGVLQDSGLVARKLATTELWTVASPAYLSAHGRPETPQDLTRHACVRDTNLRSGQAWPFTMNGQQQRVAVTGGLLVNSATAVRDLALEGEGIGLCPDYAVASAVADGRLERVLADFPSLSLDIQAMFLDARRMPARSRAVLDFLAGRIRIAVPWTNINR